MRRLGNPARQLVGKLNHIRVDECDSGALLRMSTTKGGRGEVRVRAVAKTERKGVKVREYIVGSLTPTSTLTPNPEPRAMTSPRYPPGRSEGAPARRRTGLLPGTRAGSSRRSRAS